MIDLYTWPTPNGHKIHIALEEMGLPYTVHGVNIRTGEQFRPEFLAISPNNRIPAMIDSDGPDGKPISLFESGAMLIYLASKTGKLMPASDRDRYTMLQWLMWQMGGVGPMFGQANHFRAYAKEPQPYPIERYTSESNRLCRVLDKRLAEVPFVAGEYSIADIAIFPWMRGSEKRGVNLADYPNITRWFDAINARPAVQRALKVLADVGTPPPIDDKQRDIMFGKAQFTPR